MVRCSQCKGAASPCPSCKEQRSTYYRNHRVPQLAAQLAEDKAANVCVACHLIAPEHGSTRCQACGQSHRDQCKRWRDKLTEGEKSVKVHRDNTSRARRGEGWTADSKIPKEEFQVSMYPQGWDGPRATCVVVMPNGKPCGKPGTVNRSLRQA